MELSTYSFLDVVAALSGPGANIQLGNAAPSAAAVAMGSSAGIAEEGITIAREGNKNTLTMGADGAGMNTLNAANNGTVTIRVLMTSDLNAQLMDLYNAQGASSAMWGQNVITVANPVTGDSHTCSGCAFRKAPDFTYAGAASMREWAFDAITIDSQLGSGSPALSF